MASLHPQLFLGLYFTETEMMGPWQGGASGRDRPARIDLCRRPRAAHELRLPSHWW